MTTSYVTKKLLEECQTVNEKEVDDFVDSFFIKTTTPEELDERFGPTSQLDIHSPEFLRQT